MSEFQYTILYVDDEGINIELFKNIFKKLYTVYYAYSATDGLEILNNHKIDLIITDEKMPGMTGVEFLKEVNKRFPTLPPHRIITSAYSKPASIDEAFHFYQLSTFIPKPWKLDEFRSIVKNILEGI
jgi:CheY-like chemotaxis protein